MTRKAATGFDGSGWRSWASRLTPQQAQAADLDGRRATAAKRAAAAEILAKEANAVRLKALLDAAREEAANRNIRSAEERFAAARGVWESARRGIEAEPDPYVDLDETLPADGAAPSSTATAWLSKLREIPRGKALFVGALPVLLLVGGIGAGAYLRALAEPSMTGATPIVHASIETPGAQGALASGAVTTPPPAHPALSTDTGATPAPLPKAAVIAPEPKPTPRAHAAATVARTHKRLIMPPPPPPPRPEPDSLAAGVPAPVVAQPRFSSNVE